MRSRTCHLSHLSHLSHLVIAMILALGDCVGIAKAQTTTAVLRGRIADENGPVAGASVVASDSETGTQRETASSSDGSYILTLPPASYEVVVTVTRHPPHTAILRLQVGQSIDLDFRLDATQASTEGSTFAIETRNSEIATNVTTEQIESLPQGSRNFLAFAALAPGVRFTLNENEAGKSFRSGGMEARQVNVFVDGLSYKNDLLNGGAFMQESSRGNPFPQNAVQEFRVSSQFKAEYEKTAAAVITAVTKSGGNALRGDAFYNYQDEGMIGLDEFARERGDQKPDVEKVQVGLSVGGPLVKNRLHYFASYEQDEQDRLVSVSRGSAFSQAPANVQQRLAGYPTGLLTAPFDSKLLFGKLSWQAGQPGGSQSIDISAHRRDETEIRGFGGQRTLDGAESFEVGTDVVVARHQWMLGGVLGSGLGNAVNEAALTSQKASWGATAFDPSTPRQNYFEILDTGGRDATQEFTQDKLGLRDDFSFLVDWKGSHAVKFGASASWLDYDITKFAFDNPTFNFRRAENWQFPFEAILGVGDPSVNFSNQQYGLYLQDDWQIGGRLTVNLGVRWDYETNMINNDFVTPPGVVASLQGSCRTYAQPVGGRNTWCIRDFLDLERYTTDGGGRDSYTGMLQPRVGLSYDVSGNGKTVVFGAFGKYYDRVILNDISDEQYRQSWGIYRFCFSATGAPAANCSAPTLAWRDQYLSADALRGLITSGAAGSREVFLVPNDLRPPRSTQWNLGLRQQLGNWNLAASYNSTRGTNGIAYFFGDLPPGTSFGDRFGGNVPLTGLARVFIAQPVRRWWYDGVFLTADRPYSDASRWGFNLAYTLAKAYQNGTDNPSEGVSFGAFDYGSPADYTKFAGTNDERHRLILSGTVGLPAGFRLSTLITLGSGTPFTIFDDSTGPFTVRWNEGRPAKSSFILPDAWAYRSVDLRLEWDAPAIGDRLRIGVTAEAFNLFDYENYSDFENFKPRLPAVNSRFGEPNAAFNARRFEVGLRLSF